MAKQVYDHFDERIGLNIFYDKKVVPARQKLTPSLHMAHK
jgi:hypothetical protein